MRAAQVGRVDDVLARGAEAQAGGLHSRPRIAEADVVTDAARFQHGFRVRLRDAVEAAVPAQLGEALGLARGVHHFVDGARVVLRAVRRVFPGRWTRVEGVRGLLVYVQHRFDDGARTSGDR